MTHAAISRTPASRTRGAKSKQEKQKRTGRVTLPFERSPAQEYNPDHERRDGKSDDHPIHKNQYSWYRETRYSEEITQIPAQAILRQQIPCEKKADQLQTCIRIMQI